MIARPGRCGRAPSAGRTDEHRGHLGCGEPGGAGRGALAPRCRWADPTSATGSFEVPPTSGRGPMRQSSPWRRHPTRSCRPFRRERCAPFRPIGATRAHPGSPLPGGEARRQGRTGSDPTASDRPVAPHRVVPTRSVPADTRDDARTGRASWTPGPPPAWAGWVPGECAPPRSTRGARLWTCAGGRRRAVGGLIDSG
jgi:hypothetical protein